MFLGFLGVADGAFAPETSGSVVGYDTSPSLGSMARIPVLLLGLYDGGTKTVAELKYNTTTNVLRLALNFGISVPTTWVFNGTQFDTTASSFSSSSVTSYEIEWTTVTNPLTSGVLNKWDVIL